MYNVSTTWIFFQKFIYNTMNMHLAIPRPKRTKMEMAYLGIACCLIHWWKYIFFAW